MIRRTAIETLIEQIEETKLSYEDRHAFEYGDLYP